MAYDGSYTGDRRIGAPAQLVGDAEVILEAMRMLQDVPGDTLVERIARITKWYQDTTSDYAELQRCHNALKTLADGYTARMERLEWALKDARDSFELIRLRLIGTPEKSQGAAYCQAVKSRDASAAVLQEMNK